ncbi:MAG TPA: hypothetical protein VNE63_00870 [Candidatus Acidoferrales bacterium]|nr:hypothetical protein [Candidatus Acidoferrales bacterium]
MRDNLLCDCHICCAEERVFEVLVDPSGSTRFLALCNSFPVLAKFTNISELLVHLHSPRNGDYDWSAASETLTTLIRAQASLPDLELIHSVLILAFAPTIHRTYREVCAWFRELEPEDVAQQVLTFFLELIVSACAENVAGLLPIALSRSLRKASFRWAQREQRALMRQYELRTYLDSGQAAVEPTFQSISLLNDFLDYCTRQALLSPFERQLLIKFKVDGFSGKEIQNHHTVLSEQAVHLRVHRIMQRLEDAAIALSAKNGHSKLHDTAKVSRVSQKKVARA